MATDGSVSIKAGVLTRTALDYTLDESDLEVEGVSETRIYADILTVPARAFTARGHKVVLNARILRSRGGAIDVGGDAAGDFDENDRPPTPDPQKQPGKDGIDGRNGETGGEGKPGGQILVVSERLVGSLSLLADGGRGGKGQPGGRGGQGGKGKTGNDAQFTTDDDGAQHMRRDGQPGWRGANGGTGGQGGQGGEGGAPGEIAVFLFEATDGEPPALEMSSKAGEPGDPGAPGLGGEKGPAGQGGRKGECGQFAGTGVQTCRHIKGPEGDAGTEGPGEPGADAAPRKPLEPAADAEPELRAPVTHEEAFLADPLCLGDLDQKRLTFDKARDDFTEDRREEARVLFEWLDKTLPADTGKSSEWDQLRGLLAKVKGRLDQGLDIVDPPLDKLFAEDRTVDRGALRITSMEHTLDESDLPVGDIEEARIYSDVLVIPHKTFRAPGKKVLLWARRVISEGGGTIDVSGGEPDREGDFKEGDAAPSQTEPGVEGTHGTNGAPGMSGGSIVLVAEALSGSLSLLADGGRGGNGQGGGKGGRGRQPEPGADQPVSKTAMGNEDIAGDPERGDDGDRGAQGGQAGSAGPGGQPGALQVYLVREPREGQVTLSSDAGAPGREGVPGEGGDGGLGGLGGRFRKCTFSPGSGPDDPGRKLCPLESPERRAEKGPDGGRGPEGLPADPVQTPENATPVRRIGIDHAEAFLDADRLGDLSQLEATLHQAELFYLSRDYVRADRLLRWLCRVIWSDDSGHPERGRVRARARLLIGQLMHGLEYYGKPRTWVPMLSLQNYRTVTKDLLELGAVIEKTYDAYLDAEADDQSKTRAVDDALEQANGLIGEMTAEQHRLFDRREELNKKVPDLQDDLERQRELIGNAEQSFKDAVVRQAVKCDFEQIMSLVSAILAIGVDGLGIVKTVHELSVEADQFKKLIGEITLVVETVKNLSDKFAGLVKQVEELAAAEPDTTKLVTTQEKLDELVAPYLDLPEAQKYKKLLSDYIGDAQTFNARVLELNQVALKHLVLTGQIEVQKNETEAIRQRWLEDKQPVSKEARRFMFGIYQRVRAQLLHYLFSLNAAYEYWSLRPRELKVADNKIAQMAAAWTDLQADLVRMLESDQAPDQTHRAVTYVVNGKSDQEGGSPGARDRAASFEEFRRTGHISFDIPLVFDDFYDDAFRRRYRALILSAEGTTRHDIKVLIPGATSKNGHLVMRITHSGRVRLAGPKGEVLEYLHRPSTPDYEYDIKSGKHVAGGDLPGDQFIKLSPFTSWDIQVQDVKSKRVDLSKAEEIQFTFGFGYRPQDDLEDRPPSRPVHSGWSQPFEIPCKPETDPAWQQGLEVQYAVAFYDEAGDESKLSLASEPQVVDSHKYEQLEIETLPPVSLPWVGRNVYRRFSNQKRWWHVGRVDNRGVSLFVERSGEHHVDPTPRQARRRLGASGEKAAYSG